MVFFLIVGSSADTDEVDERFLPLNRSFDETDGPDIELNNEWIGVSSSSSEVRIRSSAPVEAGAVIFDRPEGPGCWVEFRKGILTGDKTGLVLRDPKSPYSSSTSKSVAKDGFGQGATILPVELVDGREAEATKV